MAGYLGTKAVLLSTTAADVIGNAEIGGNLTVGGSLSVDGGTIKLDGNYPVGTNNVALGDEVFFSLTTGADNAAVGRAAMYDNTSGSYNTAIGANALANNTTASNNTAVGYQAGYSSTGENNTFIGRYAGSNVTTGGKNTIVGGFDGNFGGLDIRTSSNNIVLSDGDGHPRVRVDNSGMAHFGQAGAAGDGIYVHANTNRLAIQSKRNNDGDHIRFYNSSGSIVGNIGVSGSSTYYNTSSDYRLKENVVGLTGATERLKQLNPSRFNFIADADTTVDGFLAHEVQAVVPEAVTGTKDAVDADGNPEYQGIDQSKLVPLLVATIKELEARITALEAN